MDLTATIFDVDGVQNTNVSVLGTPLNAMLNNVDLTVIDPVECLAVQHGKTPLHHAAEEGNEVVELLLRRNGSVNIGDEVGRILCRYCGFEHLLGKSSMVEMYLHTELLQ